MCVVRVCLFCFVSIVFLFCFVYALFCFFLCFVYVKKKKFSSCHFGTVRLTVMCTTSPLDQNTNFD